MSKYTKLNTSHFEDSEEEIYSSLKKPKDLNPFQGEFESMSNKQQIPRQRFSRRQQGSILAFVGLVVVVAVVLSVVLTKNESLLLGSTEKRQVKDRKITLDDAISSSKFKSRPYSVNWISDDEFTQVKDDNLHQLKITNNGTMVNKEEILSAYERATYPDGGTDYSADRKFLLLQNNKKQLYRHSYYADYYIKDLHSQKTHRLLPPGYRDDKQTQIRHCAWSTQGSALVLVYKNNIYYLPDVELDMDDTNGEKERIYYQLTKDGVDKKLFNGIPDWVYEEEILNVGHAITFSESGNFLAFGKFNASAVEFYKFPKYNDQSQQYTEIEKIAYPKAGFPNPTIVLEVINLTLIHKRNKAHRKGQSSSSTQRLKINHVVLHPPAELTTSDYYYVVMKFNKEDVFVQWLNRFQNSTVCSIYDISKFQRQIVDGFNRDYVLGVETESHTTPNGWVDDDYVSPYFSTDGSYYVTLLPNNHWRHLAIVYTQSVYKNGRITAERGKQVFLTSGNYWIHDINCYDPVLEIVYFRSTKESPRKRQVYSFDIKSRTEKCITCDVKDPSVDVPVCTYWYPEFSKGCTWTTIVCQGPGHQYTSILNTKSEIYIVKEDNADLHAREKEYDLPTKVYYEVMSDNFSIPVAETRPADFDETKKYSVLFDVYGGPNTQKVTEKHEMGFSHFLVRHHTPPYGTILIEFDARGTGYNGYKFLHAVYRQIGKKEAIDCLAVAQHLANQKYVDSSRMAIWGWSYGGFYAATVLSFPGQSLFQTAVSVAPVSDWRYYDTVYSERYMSLPTKEDNLKGYEDNSVMAYAKNFKGKNFLLIHGTGDDNVHFQNSAQLSKSLIDNMVKFQQQYYPDKRHGIQTNHIWKLLARYLVAHLTDEVHNEEHEHGKDFDFSAE